MERIAASSMEAVVVTNTISQESKVQFCSKIKVSGRFKRKVEVSVFYLTSSCSREDSQILFFFIYIYREREREREREGAAMFFQFKKKNTFLFQLFRGGGGG